MFVAKQVRECPLRAAHCSLEVLPEGALSSLGLLKGEATTKAVAASDGWTALGEGWLLLTVLVLPIKEGGITLLSVVVGTPECSRLLVCPYFLKSSCAPPFYLPFSFN